MFNASADIVVLHAMAVGLAALSAGCIAYAAGPLILTRMRWFPSDEGHVALLRRAMRNRLARSVASTDAKTSLAMRLRGAGVTWSPRAFQLTFMALGCAAFAALTASGSGALLAGGVAFSLSLILPRAALSIATRRRQNAFREHFGPSLDVLLRASQAGMPLQRCLQIAAGNGQGEMNARFARLAAEITADAPAAALKRFADKATIPEARFFALAMALQQETGGNLAIALGSLSAMLRSRKAFAARVAILTAEARVSAIIIGSLPGVIALALWIASPDYLAPLWTDPRGRVCLYGAVLWALVGALTMRILIRSSLDD